MDGDGSVYLLYERENASSGVCNKVPYDSNWPAQLRILKFCI